MQSILESLLARNQPGLYPVVPFNAATERIAPLDLSKNNTQLTEAIYHDTAAFTAYIDSQRAAAGARYLTGGYNELREMYKRSQLFNFEKALSENVRFPEVAAEPRRLHLGMDIWGEAGTPVSAPLGGMLHSFAHNNQLGDYGATVILQHQLDTVVFYTLYGHLAAADLSSLRSGSFISRGQCFAHFGRPLENGNWPPHLHFQIIIDLYGKEGDYPGVCKFSEKDKYLANCPNPDLILNLNRYLPV